MATQTTTKALNELPLKKLIAEPLSAAAQSHLEISRANVDAIKGILSEGNQDFSFKSEFGADGTAGKTVELNVPMLALVDVPSFAITKLTNNFSFEVSTLQEDLSSSSGMLKGSASSGGFISKFVDIKLEGERNTSSSSKDSYSEKGKLNIQVLAEKVPAPKGLQTIIDTAMECITSKETS